VPFLQITQRSGNPTQLFDGAIRRDGRVWGTYLHGIFDNDAFRLAFVNRLRLEKGLPKIDERENFRQASAKQQQYNRLAELVRNHLDIPRIYEMMGVKRET